MIANEGSRARSLATAAHMEGTELAAELASLLHAGGGLLAVVGLLVPSLRPAHLLGGIAVALAAFAIGATYHLTRRWAWSDRALRWAVVLSGLALITAYNLATVAEPFRYSVFYFFLIVWIGLTQPRRTSLWTMPLVAVSYLVPIVVHDATTEAVLSILFIAPTLALTGELVGWFSAQRTSLRDELEAAVSELEELDQRRDLFIDTASHELRSPLATIRASLTTLEAHHGQLSEDQLARLLEAAHRQVDRMQRMVDDLLTSSRIRSGALSYQPRTVALGEELPEMVPPSLLDEVEIDTANLTGRHVHVDPDHLSQVLTNLVANAARYGEPPIVISAEAADHTISVSVTDHGPGVPEEEAAELFSRYEHGGETEGLGLGLHIVQLLAERNGGEVHHRDNEPQGAQFVVSLPAGDPVGDDG